MQAPQKVGDGKKELSAAEKRTRALKIGAAAAGGGVIVALTGSLLLYRDFTNVVLIKQAVCFEQTDLAQTGEIG